ncbi:MAG: diacylglycerol kinase family lipid kinase [Bacteroidetes bacterium]|nr:diacylglycerol kinase family lipid kinase [Bacteroidota bacterium]
MTEPADIRKKEVIFIINPASGVRSKNRMEDMIRTYLDKERYNQTILYTERAGHAIELSRKAARDKTDIVVAVGGDGSLNEIAKGLIGTDTAMGIIPAGSGNGLAHHLRIPFRISKAIETINKGKIKKIDTIRINGELCVSIAGVGFDALVAKEFEKARRRGFQTYFRIILTEYLNYKPRKYKITIDGKKYKEKALFISFANSNQFGYNASIAPHATVDDGLIDVCIIKKIPLAKVVFLANLLFLKKIDQTNDITIIKGKEIKLSRKRSKIVNIDGEHVKLKKKLIIKIDPLSLNVIVP